MLIKNEWNYEKETVNNDYFYQIIHAGESSQAKTVSSADFTFLSCRKLSQIVLFSFVIIPRNEIKTQRESTNLTVSHMSRQEVQAFICSANF